MDVFIAQDQPYSAPTEYVLRLLAVNKREPFRSTTDKASAAVIVDHSDARSVPLAVPFYGQLNSPKGKDHRTIFNGEPVIKALNGSVDHLATAFYMVNALQEYDAPAEDKDHIGRFRFERSYQKRFGCIDENLVQAHFDAFCAEVGLARMKERERPTRVFLSHDIDTVHGSFAQDGLWALKHGRIDVLFKLVFNEMVGRPDWLNFDRIHKLHDEHDLKSTFFWLVTKTRGAHGLRNADYDVSRLRARMEQLPSNGLHKSCTDLSFEQELSRMPVRTKLNRFHFLRFTVPEVWREMEAAGIELDASLGFAEHFGFRNSYGLPFQPYDQRSGRAHNLLEVPLNVMDGTLHRYMGLSKQQSVQRTITFLEKHRTNAVISILWHNTYFTQYKYQGFLQVYKTILAYLKENGITSITPTEMLHEYRN